MVLGFFLLVSSFSCARSQSVEGELYPKLMTVIRSYCVGCRLRPLLLRLPQLRRTIQYHYFHFDRSPLREPVRAEGGPAEDAGEVTSSLLCSRSSGIFIEVCERSACTLSSQDGLVVFLIVAFSMVLCWIHLVKSCVYLSRCIC